MSTALVIITAICIPFCFGCFGFFVVAPVAMSHEDRNDRKRAERRSALRIENAPRSQELVNGELAAVRAEYVGGEIEIDEFEALVERALRGETAKSPAPMTASVDAISWEAYEGTPSNRLPIRREPLPDWAKDAIDQELDRLTK